MKAAPFMILGGLLVSGCGQPGVGALMATDPAGACASAEMIAGVRKAILANIPVPVNSNIGASYRDQIVAGADLAIAKVAVTHVDAPSSTLSCSGEAKFIWPKNLTARLTAESPGGDWTSETLGVLYTARPKSGGGFDYSVESGADEAAATVQSMVTALYQSDKADYKTAEATQTAILTGMLQSRTSGGASQKTYTQPVDQAALIRAAMAAQAAQAAQKAAEDARRR